MGTLAFCSPMPVALHTPLSAARYHAAVFRAILS